jgi:hypothetical protein
MPIAPLRVCRRGKKRERHHPHVSTISCIHLHVEPVDSRCAVKLQSVDLDFEARNRPLGVHAWLQLQRRCVSAGTQSVKPAQLWYVLRERFGKQKVFDNILVCFAEYGTRATGGASASCASSRVSECCELMACKQTHASCFEFLHLLTFGGKPCAGH